LDYSQREAVIFALHSDYPISLIHGPPGTGELELCCHFTLFYHRL